MDDVCNSVSPGWLPNPILRETASTHHVFCAAAAADVHACRIHPLSRSLCSCSLDRNLEFFADLDAIEQAEKLL